ncbi:hypothetical protein [Bradyrhizobium sp. Arg816]|uniref:hypothetical protein n=1 Tax=Bradyrhizobium sp. Arg816 TaxID=2998491 RepID=UPI00249E8E43|nr:hypothetical protein [Bradyrhizobium sp. Arg816]MDI3566624.1 hypothetical protein [Bradyrhizobium sp. Arg816]
MKFDRHSNDIEYIKDALQASLPDVKSSHRVEALVRPGLGDERVDARGAGSGAGGDRSATKALSTTCAGIRSTRRAIGCCGRSRNVVESKNSWFSETPDPDKRPDALE